MSARPWTRFRGCLINLVLLGFSSLAALAAAEGLVRLLAPQDVEPHPRGLYMEDAELEFVLAPDLRGRSRSPEWDVEVRTSSMGMRERELGPKAPGSIRVLAVGDSFTFGAGVEAEEAWPRALENRLQAEGLGDVQIVNGGIPAYGTVQQAAWLERAMERLEPDMVLLAFFAGNDYFDNLGLNRYRVIRGYLVGESLHGAREQLASRLGVPPELKVMLRTNLHLYTLAMNAWSGALARGGGNAGEEVLALYREPWSEELQRARGLTLGALDDILEICHRHGAGLGLFIISDTRMAGLSGTSGEPDFHVPAQPVLNWAADHDVPAVDLTETFLMGEDLIFPVDGHWNPTGHRQAASVLAEEVLAGRLPLRAVPAQDPAGGGP